MTTLARMTTRERKGPTRSQRLIWLTALVLLIAIVVLPVSNGITRAGGLAMFFVVWFGLIFLCRHRTAIRFSLLGFTLLVGALLIGPASTNAQPAAMRKKYVDGLRRYEGATYVWGGEGFTGIDCSGLIRRGLIDSQFVFGVQTRDSGLVRRALSLWWNDCSAKALSEMHQGLTVHQFDAPNIKGLDHTKLLPGDLAVTQGGVHILAYLGEERWIEADRSPRAVQ